MNWQKALVIGGITYMVFSLGYICGGVRGWRLGEQFIIDQLRRQGIRVNEI